MTERTTSGLFVSGIVLLFLAVGLLSYWEYLDMKEHHCVRTSEERQRFYMQSMYDSKGNLTGMYPVFYTEYRYQCDNGYRWH